MSRDARRGVVEEDARKVAAIRDRGKDTAFPFAADPDDHCETSPLAYAHVVPLLKILAERLGKPWAELRIYDPYVHEAFL